MKERPVLIAMMLFLAALVGVYAVVDAFRTSRVLSDTVNLDRRGQELTTVTVFHLNPGGLTLVPGARAVPVRSNQTQTARDLITFLRESPEGLASPLPPGTRLLHCFVSPRGEITLDFSAEILNLPGGSVQEDRLRLSALLRTLSENLGPVESVRLLVEGKPLQQWGRHLRLDASIDMETWL